MRNTAIARIDLAAVRHNLSRVRALCGQSRVMAMVKANGYGHGLLPIAKALDRADGLAVARLMEALALRDAGVTQRVLLLATILSSDDLQVCSREGIDVVVHDESTLNVLLNQTCATSLRVWLKLDSGMHRAGFDPRAFERADKLLRESSRVLELIHMTHFACASDEAVRSRQLECFTRVHQSNPSAPISMANSAALILSEETRHHWIRPGIMLYGVNPLGHHDAVSVRPAMTLLSWVISVRYIPPGQSVGYDGRWTSNRVSRIGTVGIGYGDGYPRHARNGTPVSIRGHFVPLAGRVSMDSLTVDLTDHDDIEVGDEAVLWGNELPVEIVARHSTTIPYELLAGVTDRVSREYV